MNDNNIFSKILRRENYPNLIFWGLCFILFLPIVILPLQFQPSDWTRAALFKTALTALISLFLYRFFYKKDISFSLPKFGYLFYLPVLAISAYFVALILATVFSQDPRFSFFGSPSRAGGLLNSLFFFAFALFMAIFIKGNTWNKLMKISFIAGALASLLAIVQYFGLFKNVFLGFETGATPSFLGNSTFLAIYMIFMVFSSFAFFLSAEIKKEKFIYGGLFLLFLFTVFATGSRAAYFGILIAFALYFLFYPNKLAKDQNKLLSWLNPKRLKMFKAASLIFIFLIVLLVAYINITPKLPDFIENNPRLSFFVHNRLSLKTVAQDLAGTRLAAWKITSNAIKEKPLLGWGPENFHIGFEKYFDPTLTDLQRLWWDRPHNIFLEIWVNSGIFALVFYIAFWVILLWQLQIFKSKSDNNHHISFAHGLQAIFISYLVVLFFNFDSFPTYLISFFFIGYALHLISSKTDEMIFVPLKKPIPFKKPFAFIFLAAIAIFIWFWNIKPLYLNEKLVLIENLSDSKQCQKALKISNSSNWERAGIAKPYAILKYSDVVRKCTFSEPEKEVEYSQKALYLLKKASKIQPKYSRTWIFMGAFADVLAAREENKEQKNKLISEAKDYLTKARELSPKRQEVFAEWQKNYIVEANYPSMKKLANECIQIDSSIGECYWYLGIAEIFLGDQENGKKHIQESKEKNYNNPAYIQLGAAFISQKNYKDAADAYQILVSIYPERAGYHATLALLYKETGNYERAIMEALEVLKLQPEDPQTVEFINSLIGLKPGDISLHYALADAYKTLGNKEKHRAELLKISSYYLNLISQNPNAFLHHLNLAYVYMELEDYEKASKEAIIALKLDPTKAKDVENFFRLMPPEFLKVFNDHTEK